MTLKFSTSGRPMIECINPTCKKLHAIHRRGDYVKRAQVRVVCRSCGTKWHLSQQDAETLKAHYEQRQAELDEKKRMKEEKQEKKDEKPVQEKTEKSQKEPHESQKDKPKKSFFDSLWD